ncbi:MAG TPA: 16S rRNA (cytosine(1402)-N(4))-methyltransferase, partial [Gemmatimonadaceae bacterium]|nr:16S rRNA (cytosine(1402)-N(4))-methyltransferase [Gemmatimonadaceae bacterium]
MTDERFTTAYHAPVMVDEVRQVLLHGAGTGLRILDGTLGGGGHSAAFLEAGADVTGLDRDPDAIRAAVERLASFAREGRFRAIATNYADFAESGCAPASVRPAGAAGPPDAFDGILLDLGVSSHQIDDPARGFSFREGAPLDMRMTGAAGGAHGGTAGVGQGATAADFLNTADFGELATVFREYADERRAPRLASEVIRRREN